MNREKIKNYRIIKSNSEAVVQKCAVKKMFLKISQNSQGNSCARVSFFRPTTLLKRTLAQLFYCEFCEIFKNTFFNRTPWVAASANSGLVYFDNTRYVTMMYKN